ncbi:hypothetical protein OL239_00395 [Arthrobacter sp. ATA002]|uniref:hypothetical protein n=1 Tax=Arthrobacter sp. ATA002 TaxID=2991715 RepID=UPI0022A733B9|nr:hypothetical protein [Arthrobacter sp. ATA002]WAP51873.1 hypothetical protein OL239_00395 [Arthrobacter sp. ATA002]
MDSLTSREHPSSDHTLRVLVRVDTRLREACVEVRGCLTSDTSPTLMNILAHTGTLGAAVRINLLRAAHVEQDALELLFSGAGPATGECPVKVLAPPNLPVCRLGSFAAPAADRHGAPARPLTNEEALELAFLRRDPRVLAAERAAGPHHPETGHDIPV